MYFTCNQMKPQENQLTTRLKRKKKYLECKTEVIREGNHRDKKPWSSNIRKSNIGLIGVL